jgi:hypothetical protein
MDIIRIPVSYAVAASEGCYYKFHTLRLLIELLVRVGMCPFSLYIGNRHLD